MFVERFDETLFFSVIDHGLHRAPSFMGVLGTIQGIGAIAGGLTAAALLRRIGDSRLVGAGILLFGLGNALLIPPALGTAVSGVALAGAGLSWAVVGLGTAIQVRTPRHLQGRVYSASELLVGTPQTLSIAMGAALSALSALVDYRFLLLTVAVVMAACGAYLAPLRRSLRPAATEEPACGEESGSDRP